MGNDSATNQTPSAGNRTKIGLRADMTIDEEPVAIEGLLGGDFFLQLSKPATLGTPISFAYWLRDKYQVGNLDIMLPEQYETAAEFKTAYKQYKSATTPADRSAFETVIGDHLNGQVPPQLVNLVRTAFLAELTITDLIIDIKTKETDDGKSEVTSQKMMFGLSVGFPAPLDLIPNVEVNKVSILVMNAPKDDFEFPTRVALLGAKELTMPPRKATGHIAFTDNPAPNSTITLGEDTWKFVTGDATDDNLSLGSNLEASLTKMAIHLNAREDGATALCSYHANLDAQRLEITYRTAGFAGNSFRIATSPASNATVSGATLSGGFSSDESGDEKSDAAKARGTIAFSDQPADASTIKLNGVAWAFSKNDPKAGSNASKLGDTPAASVANLAKALAESANPKLKPCSYAAEGTTLTITSNQPGKEGNSFTIEATDASNGKPSGPTLTGG